MALPVIVVLSISPPYAVQGLIELAECEASIVMSSLPLKGPTFAASCGPADQFSHLWPISTVPRIGCSVWVVASDVGGPGCGLRVEARFTLLLK